MFTAQKEAWDADEGVIDSWDQLEVPDQPVPQKVKQEMRREEKKKRKEQEKKEKKISESKQSPEKDSEAAAPSLAPATLEGGTVSLARGVEQLTVSETGPVQQAGR